MRPTLLWLVLFVACGCSRSGARGSSDSGTSVASAVVDAPRVPPVMGGASAPEPTENRAADHRSEEQAREDGRRAGRDEATAALARGFLGYQSGGAVGYASPPSPVTIADILARDFGVTVIDVPGGGCIPTPAHVEAAGRVEGYNEVMVAELERRHGANVMSIAAERAKRESARAKSAPGAARRATSRGDFF